MSSLSTIELICSRILLCLLVSSVGVGIWYSSAFTKDADDVALDEGESWDQAEGNDRSIAGRSQELGVSRHVEGEVWDGEFLIGCSLPVALWESDGVWHCGRGCCGFGALLHVVTTLIPPCFVILSFRTLYSDFKKRSRVAMGDGGGRRIKGFGRGMSRPEAANWDRGTLGRGFRACNPGSTFPPFPGASFPKSRSRRRRKIAPMRNNNNRTGSHAEGFISWVLRCLVPNSRGQSPFFARQGTDLLERSLMRPTLNSHHLSPAKAGQVLSSHRGQVVGRGGTCGAW